jgi:hypothetical protein
MHAFHVNERHGTRGHAQWSGRDFPTRPEATPLRLPEVIGEPNGRGNLKTDQPRRETMGPPTNREVQGGRAAVVPKCLGQWPGQEEGPQGAPMRLHQPSCGSRSSTRMEGLKALAYLTPKGEGDSSGQ